MLEGKAQEQAVAKKSRGIWKEIAGKAGLFLTSIALSLGVIEGAFRAINYNFSPEARFFNSMPICYQLPIKPIEGEGVFFRRAGPAVWKGKPITTEMRMVGVKADIGEKKIKATYDKYGFRNPMDLKDWDVVIAGDSFTEGCALDDNDIFTRVAGELLGVSVKNLGVGGTGPLSHLCYLRHYGKPENRNVGKPKIALLAFFHGNDILDLMRENRELDIFKKTGEPEQRLIPEQNSALKFVWNAICENTYEKIVGATIRRAAATPHYSAVRGRNNVFRRNIRHYLKLPIHYFIGSDGKYNPITIGYGSIWQDITFKEEEKEALSSVFYEFANFSRQHGMIPGIIRIPGKYEVLQKRVLVIESEGVACYPKQRYPEIISPFLNPESDIYIDSVRVLGYISKDIPRYLEKKAEELGMIYIDPTGALQEETNKGRITYFGLYDEHLNAHGSYVVGREIAKALRPYFNREISKEKDKGVDKN